ncbi:uncharacterized protein LOC135083608 [Ostrinia nubilalis]|uniref:uncharacterized protein LOC135083608 n=1 Tax=Ostrinia nubilalis TaxID=29057 RepID=UPI0030825A9F
MYKSNINTLNTLLPSHSSILTTTPRGPKHESSKTSPHHRRQFAGYQFRPKNFVPPSDHQIARLLNYYRGIVHKFGRYPQKSASTPMGAKFDRFGGKKRTTRFGRNTKAGGLRQDLDNIISPQQGLPQEVPKELVPQEVPVNAPVNAPVDASADSTEELPRETKEPQARGDLLTQGTTMNEAQGQATRFTVKRTQRRRRIRTTPPHVSFDEKCDYLAYYCLRTYDTGVLCGRTLYYVELNFTNYCMLDYVNCMERYDVWQILHMGECFELKVLDEYLHYPYLDDYFLDHYYVIEDM